MVEIERTDDIFLVPSADAADPDRAPNRVVMAYRNAVFSNRSEHTRRAYIHDIRYAIRVIARESNRPENDVLLNLPTRFRREHAIAYRDLLRALTSARGMPLADGTINRRLSVLSAVFREFIRENLATVNPFEGLTAGYECEPTPALSKEERQRLLDGPDFEAAPTRRERQIRLRDKMLLALLFIHGVRQNEARLLKTTDLARNEGYPTAVVVQKGGKTITHRLHPKLWHYLEMYKDEFMPGDGYFFTGLASNCNSEQANPLSAQAISDIVRKWAKRAGLDRVTPHVGRATVITEALKKAPLQVVARSIGHASIQSTARYDRNRNRMDQAIMTYQDCEL